MYRLLVAIAILGAACKGKDKDPAGGAPSAAASPACAQAKPHGPLRWIEDDYGAALACAKARKVPVVVDLWAPWCHTCLSMKSAVFTDPSFQADAERFVFLALDTDRELNAPAVAKYPLSAWPTFYVIDADQNVLARYVGAASVSQFHAFLDAGLAAVQGVDGAAKHLLAAERAIAAHNLETAELELQAALTAAPAGWVRTPDALVSLIHTKSKRGDKAGCLTLAEQKLDETGTSASATDFAGLALDCASALAQAEPQRVPALRERVIARLTALLADPKAQLSVDDRSDAMVYLRETLETVGRKPEAINIAEKQRMMLDDAAAKAKDPKTAMTFNWHLAEAYVYLGRPLEAVPALERSAKALPNEYDPAARLGWVYLKADKLDEAARWTDQAIALAYGARTSWRCGSRCRLARPTPTRSRTRRRRSPSSTRRARPHRSVGSRPPRARVGCCILAAVRCRVLVTVLVACAGCDRVFSLDRGDDAFEACSPPHLDDSLRYALANDFYMPLSPTQARAVCARRGMDLLEVGDAEELAALEVRLATWASSGPF